MAQNRTNTSQTAPAAQATNTRSSLSSRALSGINNLRVNYKKSYELSKNKTKFVVNMIVHSVAAVAVAHLTLGTGSILLILGGSFVVYKLVEHGIDAYTKFEDKKSLILRNSN